MSRYSYSGKEQRYQISLGFDTSLPLPSLFGQVEDLTEVGDGAVIDEEAEEGPLLWVSGSNAPLVDLPTLVSALAPYGSVPLDLQLRLLAEMDEVKPFGLTAFGKELAKICRQAPNACLSLSPKTEETLLLLNEHGWQMHPRDNGTRLDQTVARLLFPKRPETTIEPLGSYLLGDPSIILRIDEYGASKALPIYAILARGILLSGPVIFANATCGLAAKQVAVIGQEAFFVDAAIRDQVTSMWYHAWSTPTGRGW